MSKSARKTIADNASDSAHDHGLSSGEMEAMQKIVRFVLEKRGRRSKGFAGHFIDLFSLQPLDEDSPSFRDLGFLEDKIMLSHYFVTAENEFLRDNQHLIEE